MARETRYLIAIVLLVCVGVTAYDVFGSQPPPETSGPADPVPRAVVYRDRSGSDRQLAPSWSGKSEIAPLLHVDLTSALRFVRRADGGLAVSYTVGSDRAEPAAPQPVVATWSAGVARLAWKGHDNDYEIVVPDGESNAQMFVLRNRVNYRVAMASSEVHVAPASTAARFASGLGAVIKEGWFIVRPRLVGLLVSYAVIAGLFYAAYWLLLKKRLAHRKIQVELPKKGSVLFEIKHSFIAIIAIALFSFLLVFGVESGHTRMYRNIAEYGWGYWFFSLAVLLVLVDAYVYWTHRLMHHSALFRHFHKIHHHSYRPTPWATFSVNVNEIIVNALFMPMVVLVMPVHTTTTLAFATVSLIKNVMNHLGFEVFPARANKSVWRWLVSPTYHELHHTRFNGNYGAYFTWWDRWMGTEHAQYNELFEQVRGRTRAGRVVAAGALAEPEAATAQS